MRRISLGTGTLEISKEVQVLRELGMTQAIYSPVFESPDRATFTAGMKIKIL